MPFLMTNDQTLEQVIRAVCALCSLPLPADPAGSTDPNIVLMRVAANNASTEMLNTYEWEALTKRGTINVSGAGEQEKAFDLPEDFYRFIDQTQWNDAMKFPAMGPIAPQGWMTYLTFPVNATFALTWQVRERQIYFLNPPIAPGQDFKFMYLSRALVKDANDPTLYKNVATKNGDQFVLDGLLMTLLTKVKWLEAKEFDSSTAVRDFLLAFDSRVGAAKGANILNMCGPRGTYPYISTGNLPDASLYGIR